MSFDLDTCGLSDGLADCFRFWSNRVKGKHLCILLRRKAMNPWLNIFTEYVPMQQ